MNYEKIGKCNECGCKDLDDDKEMGELVCNSCGTVLSENIIDYQHPSTQVGDGAHISSSRNDSLVAKNTRRTYIDAREARKLGMGNLIRIDQRANCRRNVRANDILDEIRRLSNCDSTTRTAEMVINMCFTDNPEYSDYGELPRNQMRYMMDKEGKGPLYVISVCAIATQRILSEMNQINYYLWKIDAKELGLDYNDVHRCVNILRNKITRYCTTNRINHHRTLLINRSRALYAFEERLRNWVKEKNIVGAQPLLEWVEERIRILDDNGDGPMGDVQPDMLLAMITICGLEENKIPKLTKTAIAEDIFLLTVGGVNSKLKQKAGNQSIKTLIKEYKRKGTTA